MFIIFLGILWGFLEATVGGLMHFLKIPFTGAILGSIGCAILYVGLKRGNTVKFLCFIPIIAASMKFLDIFIFRFGFLEPTVVRPAIAILMQGFAFIGVASLDRSFSLKKVPLYSLIISAASFLGFIILFKPRSQFNLFWQVGFMTVFSSILIYLVHVLETVQLRLIYRPVSYAIVSLILVVLTGAVELLIGK